MDNKIIKKHIGLQNGLNELKAENNKNFTDTLENLEKTIIDEDLDGKLRCVKYTTNNKLRKCTECDGYERECPDYKPSDADWAKTNYKSREYNPDWQLFRKALRGDCRDGDYSWEKK